MASVPCTCLNKVGGCCLWNLQGEGAAGTVGAIVKMLGCRYTLKPTPKTYRCGD